MKKAKQVIIWVIMIMSIGLSAQISVNEDGSTPDGSAILDIKSSTKGLLLPRMTESQIATISKPGNGLLVFNTDDSRYYVFIDADNLWKEIEIGTSNISMPPSIGDYQDGGVVFYIFQDGDPGYIAGETHGLICAITDQSVYSRWYNGTYMLTGASSTAVGTGNSNTGVITSLQGGGYYAAQICVDCDDGNWFLPSLDELSAMYNNKSVIDSTAASNGGGTFVSTWYWSSSEVDINIASLVNFGFGNIGGSNKEYYTRVRAIRAF